MNSLSPHRMVNPFSKTRYTSLNQYFIFSANITPNNVIILKQVINNMNKLYKNYTYKMLVTMKNCNWNCIIYKIFSSLTPSSTLSLKISNQH